MEKAYFGFSDATNETDQNIIDYFYASKLYRNNLKRGDRESGICVVVGPKASGKTHVRRMIDLENSHQLVWSIDRSQGFRAEDAGSYPAPIENLLINVLLSGLVDLIKQRKADFSNAAFKEISNLRASLVEIFARFLSGTKVKAGVEVAQIEWNFEKILSKGVSKIPEFSKVGTEEYRKRMMPCLEEKQAYILIDDVDDVFTGAEANHAFVEGLINAAVTLNRHFGKYLHCLLFIKSGLYRMYVEKAGAPSRAREFIDYILWDEDELIELLAIRIRKKLGMDRDERAWRSWTGAFEAKKKKEVEAIQEYLIDRCNTGPRDLIMFSNMAKEKSGEAKISLKDIQSVEDRYSYEKLYLVNSEFGKVYPEIANLLGKVFAGRDATHSKGQLIELIKKEVLQSGDIKESFGRHEYIRLAYPDTFLEALYDIGFIGFRRNRTSRFLYAMTHLRAGSELYDAYEHRIHPAFWSYLRLK